MSPEEIPVILQIANEFRMDGNGMARITPFGDFPHERGIQRVTPQACQRMEAEYATAGHLKFAEIGIPLWNSHPDCAEFADTAKDARQYGLVTQLKTKEDGLYGKVNLTEHGAELVRGGKAYLSPYWIVKAIANEGGRIVYQPNKIKSIGLTQNPNLPAHSLANSKRNMTKAASLFLIEVNLAQKRLGVPFTEAWKFVQRTNVPLYSLAYGTATQLANALGASESTLKPSALFECASPYLKSLLGLSPMQGETDFVNALERVKALPAEAKNPIVIELSKCLQINAGMRSDEAWKVLKDVLPELYATMQH